jgi:hypothetical protein
MLHSLAASGVGDVNWAVFGLDDRWIGILTGFVF